MGETSGKHSMGAQTADMESTNSFWKNQWRIWFESQTTEIQEAYLNWEHQWEEFSAVKLRKCRRRTLIGKLFGAVGSTIM